MWSDRYDGEFADVFAFQDAIARQIAGTLAANILGRRPARAEPSETQNPSAFDLALRARALDYTASRTAKNCRRFAETDDPGDRARIRITPPRTRSWPRRSFDGDPGLD